ncbi:PAS domain-containing protein [Loktanella sp. M215]|nr:PAS domain-containing protein [Loktanella sp. M215]
MKAMDDISSVALTAMDLSDIVATFREGLLVLTEDLTIAYASDKFLTMFQVDRMGTVGRSLADMGDGRWNIPALLEPIRAVVTQDVTLENLEVDHHFELIGRKVMRLNVRKTVRAGDNARRILLAIEDVTARRLLETERDKALAQSTRLLEELNHRVMNSMSMIGSVISMEGRAQTDVACRAAFTRLRTRIEAIGTLYRVLSRTGAVDCVEADDYLNAIMRDAVAAMEASPGAISLDLSVSDIQLSTRTAVPLGLITNELVTNSLKYAYNGRDTGKLGLGLAKTPDGIEITFWDDGSGIDKTARVDSGLGQKLVEAFVQQLGGVLTQTSDQHGTRHSLAIPNGELSRI